MEKGGEKKEEELEEIKWYIFEMLGIFILVRLLIIFFEGDYMVLLRGEIRSVDLWMNLMYDVLLYIWVDEEGEIVKMGYILLVFNVKRGIY